jgi:hypothetical protein
VRSALLERNEERGVTEDFRKEALEEKYEVAERIPCLKV